jgi:hypothetical protein
VTRTTVKCAECGSVLDEDPSLTTKPPCPTCGSTRRSIEVELEGTATVFGTLALERLHTYLTYAPLWLLATAALAIGGAALTSFILTCWLAFVASLLVAVVSFFFGLRAATRVLEREKVGTFK